MILRNQVEWALHCCVALSELPADQYVSTKALAEFHGVPKEYLSKALQALAQAGLVDTTLGPTGGYRLAKRPEDISFLDIVEAVEGPTQTFKCTEIRKNNPCLKKTAKFSPMCSIAKVMNRADEAWKRELRSMNLKILREELTDKLSDDQLQKGTDWLLSRR
ncbi:RrF2 family transcriptional regulator [Bdellovibrio svalbardensis]|uniref:Rrf2 family transcriptional regulator n=1 Tax=Bdellovibrio svalbardensis TaxID=2972972 RepID=A0ABT6DL74_9BACT|nr:Rrf2 family transcriptional regulator [Bdellovibrio svalbardensis]MDG0817630.1 Rrf2 family transcriptional regulator [Bdellovibrio svalbardensis]